MREIEDVAWREDAYRDLAIECRGRGDFDDADYFNQCAIAVRSLGRYWTPIMRFVSDPQCSVEYP